MGTEIEILITLNLLQFLSLANASESSDRGTIAKTNLREYFLHVVNGVDLLYNAIDDPSIQISVSIRAFGILQEDAIVILAPYTGDGSDQF
ncbi:hypothetical protein CHS0354_019067 [Potamilus streckersoni]|uniref:Uncharacterized protein n=1 Tax=Potamilus streckersoni TaxID=2493646 RepID=A0AAE0T670_9BIVA|nr:hypothetical protein CHS0354_019067 [Potamilus streckersoni]